MAETFLSYSGDEEIKNTNYSVVPIPTATSRMRQRSFGHAELLAGHLSKILKIESCCALGRLGQQRQVGSRREARRAQAGGSYYLRRPNLVKGRSVLLIDDVVTTGATLAAATQMLRQSGAKHVDALVFAKSL
ncbi:ComF family protein [Candidatus Saccharibacteria bacterium]|nr:ComF family protein [Candidatus Saccharibacteria bacterium]